MFERFDQSAKQALVLSGRIAYERGRAAVELDDLALALEDGAPDTPQPASEEEQPILRFSHSSKRALAYAAEESEKRRSLVSPAHLRIGIRREQLA